MKKTIGYILFVLMLLLGSSGCGTSSTPESPAEPVVTKAPTNTPEPTATATLVPSPTPLPGSVVLPVDTLGDSIPWLPLDNTKRPGVNYVGFNTENPPFNNALVRQAFAYAVDREEISAMATHYATNSSVSNNITSATTFTPPQTLGRDLYGVVGINFDPQQAKDLLTEAGYSDTSSFPKVIFLVNASGEVAPGARFNMASAMAKMWKTHFGIDVEVQAIASFGEYNERLKSNPPDLFWMGWAADYNDPANFIGEIFNPNGENGGEINRGNYSNPDFLELINKAAASNNPAERQELYIQAEQLLCEVDAAVIPLFHLTYNF